MLTTEEFLDCKESLDHCNCVTHFGIAIQAESLGFTVEMDSENNERSLLLFSDKVVGEILGDAEAKVYWK